MRHLIDITDLSLTEREALLDLGEEMLRHPGDFADAARGRILATLFFEPSTRTRLSFESAMLGLGGGTLGFSEASSSSAAKGESVADTIRTVGCYADLIAIRHPKEGASLKGAFYSPVPVLNAGDGGHCHPTQTLTDLLTIRQELGRVEGLTVGFCGDLKYGRTVHSLVNALAAYRGVKLVFISPRELSIPGYMKEGVLRQMPYTETDSLPDALPGPDLLYMTRIQRERFADQEEYQRLKDSFILTPQLLRPAREHMVVLHPLPRVNEISVAVDDDPRAAYFRQVKCGRFVRMALIQTLLSGTLAPRPAPDWREYPDCICQNPACITAVEQEPRRLFLEDGEVRRCAYCEAVYR